MGATMLFHLPYIKFLPEPSPFFLLEIAPFFSSVSSPELEFIPIFFHHLSRLAAPHLSKVSKFILSSGIASLAHFIASLAHFIFLVLARCLMKCLSSVSYTHLTLPTKR